MLNVCGFQDTNEENLQRHLYQDFQASIWNPLGRAVRRI